MELSSEQEHFLQTMEKSLGILSVALQKSEVSRQEYDGWLENKEFIRRLEIVKETAVDYVENKLLTKINTGDLQAIQYYLKTKGKKRGYVERTQTDLIITPKKIDTSKLSDEALDQVIAAIDGQTE